MRPWIRSLPTTNNQQPTTSNQQPTTNNQQPTTNNQQQTTTNDKQRQMTNDKQQPTTTFLDLNRPADRADQVGYGSDTPSLSNLSKV